MSKLDEMNARPATHSMTARINAKYLATLILFWKSKGIEGNSSSQLVRLSLETFADFLTTNNLAVKVDSTEEALKVIQKCGYKIGRISSKAIVTELIKEDASMDFLESTDPTKIITPKKEVTKTDLEIAQELMRKQEEEDLQTRIRKAQANTQDTLKNLNNVD